MELFGGVLAFGSLARLLRALHELVDALGAFRAAEQDERREALAVEREVAAAHLEAAGLLFDPRPGALDALPRDAVGLAGDDQQRRVRRDGVRETEVRQQRLASVARDGVDVLGALFVRGRAGVSERGDAAGAEGVDNLAGVDDALSDALGRLAGREQEADR